MAFKSRLKCLFLKPIFCILFATFLHFARNTTIEQITLMKKYFGISSTFSELKKSDIHELAIYADHEANPLYPVPVLWGVKELEKVYDFVVED